MRTIGLDLNAVAVFLEVIDRRSFRAAATALGMPKSTVSQKVRRPDELEDAIAEGLDEVRRRRRAAVLDVILAPL